MRNLNTPLLAVLAPTVRARATIIAENHRLFFMLTVDLSSFDATSLLQMPFRSAPGGVLSYFGTGSVSALDTISASPGGLGAAMVGWAGEEWSDGVVAGDW